MLVATLGVREENSVFFGRGGGCVKVKLVNHCAGDQDATSLELAFSKKKIEERKAWLQSFTAGTFLDQSADEITYSDFVDKVRRVTRENTSWPLITCLERPVALSPLNIILQDCQTAVMAFQGCGGGLYDHNLLYAVPRSPRNF
jgi:hypothetical protein